MASPLKSLKEHQTTLRFSEEMWEELLTAAGNLDVSVAQYVRDAARVRLEHDARASARPTRTSDEPGRAREVSLENAARVREISLAEAESTAAVWEQGRLARERAQLVREEARRLREVGPALRRRVAHARLTPPPWEAGRTARERLKLAPHDEPREPRSR